MNRDTYYDSLKHHGILGQKWGKKNGPPYPLNESDKSSAEKKHSRKPNVKSMSDEELSSGLKRMNLEKNYSKAYDESHKSSADSAWKAVESSRQAVNDAKKVVDAYSKATEKKVSTSNVDISKLSDKELQQIVNRMNLERSYANLTTKTETSKGAEYVRETLEIAGSIIATAGTAITIAKYIKEAKGR